MSLASLAKVVSTHRDFDKSILITKGSEALLSQNVTQNREMWLDRIDGVGCEKQFQVPLPVPSSCLWWSHCGSVPGKVSGKEAVTLEVGVCSCSMKAAVRPGWKESAVNCSVRAQVVHQ